MRQSGSVGYIWVAYNKGGGLDKRDQGGSGTTGRTTEETDDMLWRRSNFFAPEIDLGLSMIWNNLLRFICL